LKLPSPLPRRANEPIGPLIDIVFLLLIFFMLVGTLKPPEPLPVEPPSSRYSEKRSGQQQMVSLTADGRLAFAGQTLTKRELVRILKRRFAENAPLTVALKADAAAKASEVIAVLDALRQAGIERLSLLTVTNRAP
jgi:biopolymer transport protein ExbD